MGRLRNWMQHRLNAVHVRCRLYRWADALASAWERWVHPLLYRRAK